MAKEFYLQQTVPADVYNNGYMRLIVEMEVKEKIPKWAKVLKSKWISIEPFDVNSHWRYVVLFSVGEK